VARRDLLRVRFITGTKLAGDWLAKIGLQTSIHFMWAVLAKGVFPVQLR
jgi:hypothetical protein